MTGTSEQLWYAVWTRSNCERLVAANLLGRSVAVEIDEAAVIPVTSRKAA